MRSRAGEAWNQRFVKLSAPQPVHQAMGKVKFAAFTRTAAECVSTVPIDAVWTDLLDEA